MTERPSYVSGATDELLNREILPSPNGDGWTPHRQAAVVAAVRGGLVAAPMADTLALISKLKDELNRFPRATPDECWKTVQAIETSLDGDPEYSPTERVLVQRLKSAVSDIIAAHWEGVRVPSGLATLPLSSLGGSIRRGRNGSNRKTPGS